MSQEDCPACGENIPEAKCKGCFEEFCEDCIDREGLCPTCRRKKEKDKQKAAAYEPLLGVKPRPFNTGGGMTF